MRDGIQDTNTDMYVPVTVKFSGEFTAHLSPEDVAALQEQDRNFVYDWETVIIEALKAEGLPPRNVTADDWQVQK